MMVVLLAAALVLPACLAPQPLVPDDDGNGLNDPPRILGRSPEPAVIHTQSGCKRQRLEVLAIEDMDERDSIEVRWFVNYQLGNTEPVVQPPSQIRGGFQDGIRSPPGDHLDLFFDRYDDPVLVVEAVVSDGFDPDPAREPANRVPAKGKGITQTSWTIFVESVQECLP